MAVGRVAHLAGASRSRRQSMRSPEQEPAMSERPATEEELRGQVVPEKLGDFFGRSWIVVFGVTGLVLVAGGLSTILSPRTAERLGGMACLLFGVVFLIFAGGWLFDAATGKNQEDTPDKPRPGRVLAFNLPRLRPPAGCLAASGVVAGALLAGGILFVIAVALESSTQQPATISPSDDRPDPAANWAVGIGATVIG